MNAATQSQWLVLPADIGRCGGQERCTALSSTLESQPLREAIATGSPIALNLPEVALACFLVLLHRHSNQSTVTISVVGESGSAVPATFEFEDQTLFTDVLAAMPKISGTQNSAEISLQNFDAPTSFVFQTLDAQKVDPKSIKSGGLCIICTKVESALKLQLIFDGQSFRVDRMQEFLSQYGQLLEQSVIRPDSRVLEYSLITPIAQALLPDPAQAIEIPRYPLLTGAFADAASKFPSAAAIRKDGKVWTYRELDRTSLNLANHLHQNGVRPGDVVAVSGPRSYGVVSSVLAVFRSGATLLTIDPKLPLERQTIVRRQAGAKILVRIGETKELDNHVPNVIYVDPAAGTFDIPPDGADEVSTLPVLDPTAPAYIFFTSGSTGTPKGVVGTHQGLAHFLDWQRKTFDIGPGDRAAQITTLSFDMVLRDMFLALSCGATLCIPAEEDVLNPSAILPWMAAENISVLHLVPSLLRAWISHVPSGLALPNLRRVFLAGEPLTDTLIRSFRDAFGTSALITNFYGPTETTLIKCFYPIVEPEPGVQPVGKPQPQTQVLVLNRLGRLCGIHEIGELAIRTPFRTLGYLNAPDATAQVFVPNPFRDDPTDLIYKTGDSGFYRADGILVMRGRIDNQVKIRGMRVEPGEVEAAIAHCSAVAEVAVVAHEHETNGKFLAAYIVPKNNVSEETGLGAEVRDFLRQRLPDNMIPSVFVVMNTLPLLPNGKIDRKSLKVPNQAPDADDASSLTDLDAPKSDREAELLAVWRSVLGHSRIGVNDSFVELGGDSLTAISALVRMQRLGIPDLFARGIFQGWSIRQITDMTEGKSSDSQAIAMPSKVRTNLLVNVLRGLLVAILVTGHWFEGLLNRLPASIRGAQEALFPLFAVATPGFAMLFGLGLGYIYFPKYQTDPALAKRSLRLGAWLVIGGIIIRAASDLAILGMNNGLTDSTAFFNTFYSALLYYAIAISTAPAWMRFISRSSNSYRAIFLLMGCFYLIYQAGQILLLPLEQVGFLQLCRLMLVAKFNYFNMSVGALLGFAGGIYLHRWSTNGKNLTELAGPSAILGTIACSAGLLLLYDTTGSLAGLRDEGILPAWKWIFYGGTLLLVTAALSHVLTRYERLYRPVRTGLNLFGVLGQISLPVFVLHQLVLRLKALLVYAGMPDGAALVLPLIAFLAFCGWMMHRLYGLYYGTMQEPGNTQPADKAALAGL